MAFQYVLTFSLLILEMIMFSLISFPLPSKIRRPLLKTLSIPFNSQQFQVVLKCIFVFIGIMFADSINRTIKVTNELYNSNNFNNNENLLNGGISRAEIQSRRFYSQRNMYLCGFTLFLSLILNRTYKMVFELLEVKEKVKFLESDSSNNLSNSSKNLKSNNSINLNNDENLKLRIKELETEKENLLKKSKALSDEY
ncbi:hypothetical protein C6P40_000706 [Pichia californica]|uniref:Endoplasmic reticulum transmembrane protein n=1 Tax=Pichia californica TaxID=460514 RepID=A0A9P6WMW9_9ASCO|nr:hypothetical protein C6P42_000753 [[Candida] californica]KAG0688643.1 hypothetical protein C6P40_000706 [[Candida] californica]